MIINRDINEAILSGTLAKPFVYNNSVGDQRMFASILNVERRSGVIDKVPLRIREEDVALLSEDICSKKIKIRGPINSLHSAADVTMNVKIRAISSATDEAEDQNKVMVSGKISKIGKIDSIVSGKILRNLEIISVSYYGREVHIPVIVWGKDALRISENDIGRRISIVARFQSRVVDVAREEQQTKVLYTLAVQEMRFS